MSLAPVDIFIRVGYRFLLSAIVNLYPRNPTRLHFRYSTYRITHVSLVPFHTSQPENCSTDVCNFILLSVTHYTLLRKVVRPCREERKNEDRRSALARRNIFPLRRKMSLRSSAYFVHRVPVIATSISSDLRPSGIPRATRTLPEVRSSSRKNEQKSFTTK